MSIAAIVNFCTNDYPFLKTCLSSLEGAVDQILVTVCDHFYNGEPENRARLEDVYAEHPQQSFIEFAYDSVNNRLDSKQPQFWANLSRMLGWAFADPKIDYLLFLDCDEIIDPDKFANWKRVGAYRKADALQLACFWYFLRETLQAICWDDTPVLVKKSALQLDALFDPLERGGIYTYCRGPKSRQTVGIDGLPMVHHYSWVRTEKQMLRKVRTWTHRNDRDWVAAIKNGYSDGKDFVHGWELQEVAPFAVFDLYSKPRCIGKNYRRKNVRFVDTKEIHRIELQLRFNLYVS